MQPVHRCSSPVGNSRKLILIHTVEAFFDKRRWTIHVADAVYLEIRRQLIVNHNAMSLEIRLNH